MRLEHDSSASGLEKIGYASMASVALVAYGRAMFESSIEFRDQRYFSLFDDAMISMTYARNLAEGHGLRWNVAEPPVEGYTNFFWTLVMAGVHATGVSDAKSSLVVMILGAALLLLAATASSRIARHAGGPLPAVLAFGVVVLSFPLMFWSIRGMEVGLIAALSMVAFLKSLHGPPSQSRTLVLALAAALLLTRMDAVVVVGALLLFRAGRCETWRERGRTLATEAAACGAVIGAHTAFRYSYYGDLLPNTYYLKVTGFPVDMRLEAGARYLWEARGLWLSWLLVAVLTLPYQPPRVRWLSGTCVAMFLLQAMYSVYVGGDAWEQSHFLNRYLAQAVPPLAIAAVVGLHALGKPGLTVAVTLWLFIASESPNYVAWRATGWFQLGQDMTVLHDTLRIRDALAPDARIAVVQAGMFPYFTRRPATDLLGKSDRLIARDTPHWLGWFYPGHMKWNYESSLTRYQPDLIYELWFPTDSDRDLIRRMGYEQIRDNLYVKAGSSKVNRAALQ